MDINDKALNELVLGIVTMIKRQSEYLKFNKGVTGRVVESLGDNKYSVKINDKTYTAYSKDSLSPNQIVKMIKWNNSFNELYVIY